MGEAIDMLVRLVMVYYHIGCGIRELTLRQGPGLDFLNGIRMVVLMFMTEHTCGDHFG